MDLNKNAKPNETIRKHTDKLKEDAEILFRLGYISDKRLYDDLLVACEFHDYGKANSEFQKRIRNGSKFNPATEIPHSVLSLFYIDKEKCNNYLSVCFSVLYHHYHSDADSPKSVLDDEADLINKFLLEMGGTYVPYRKMKLFANKIAALFRKTFDDEEKLYAALLKGFLHKCDYSASAGIECEIENDFLDSIMQAWLESDPKIRIRPLQKFCLENTDSDLIVTAPTGMGKTEAGLFWCGNHKCFFVLPLKTAINAMYDRIKELSGKEYENRVALIHSDMKAKYLSANDRKANEFNFDYCLRSRQMSIPITVCTPDQIFDFVMKYPGYEYKLATGSYSKFIIDEIQMYSSDILAAIIYAIEILHKAEAKFAVLTATLPPFVKKELLRIFGEDVKIKDFSSFGITRHNVKVCEKNMQAEDIIDVIDNKLSDKTKKFLVVCNTIDIANSIYEKLKDHYNGKIEVNLFHSRFIRKDRKIKESQILKAEERTKPEIWVSTSVVEASLDIDFDMLFTELSDLFSLFQRFGRVNRKGEKDFNEYNAYVFTELQGNARKGFIDKTIHQLSKDAIMTIDGIITETDKNSLIEEYLSVERIENSDYYEKYKKSYKYYSEKIEYIDKDKSLRDIDNVSVIPKKVYDANLIVIKQAQDIINSDEYSYSEKLEANERIMDLTVPVSRYRLMGCGTVGYVGNYYDKIPVLDNCDYNENDGLIITGKAESDTIGGFIDF